MIEENIVLKIRENEKKVILENNLIEDGDNLVIGVSGGPDSMCLLDSLIYLKKVLKEENNIDFNIEVAHLNHLIREEAKSEKIYVESYCKENNIPFHYKEVNVKEISKLEHISEETCGRNARYDFFEEMRTKLNAQKIVVAHNLNDNVETILLNIIRGSGLKGLTGMSYTNGYIIRPLLDTTKEDILKYNEIQNLNPCFDKTNEMDIYSRNKIRLKLLPILKNEYNSNIMENIIRMKHILEIDEDFLSNYTDKLVYESILSNNNECIKFNFSKILDEHESIKRRCIRKIITLRYGSIDGVESVHILDILKLLQNNITGKRYILGNKFEVKILKKNIAAIY